MNILSKKIGIIGGGQLGKMMILDAKRLGFSCVTLDPALDCPSHSISDEHIIGAFNDQSAMKALAEKVDVITYEFEHIHAKYLKLLEEQGHTIYPSPKALLQIQDKFIQKTKLKEAGVAVPDFIQLHSREELKSYIKANGEKGMLKSRLGGYDGKGNALILSMDDVDSAYDLLGGDEAKLMIEAYVPFEKEISVLACRGIKGEICIYPVGENHHKNSILDETLVPARISQSAYDKALELAGKVMNVFDGVGMFCVELFVTDKGEVLVNEVAPRPHNSGHYTIEGCFTSQFEQHIRAITGLPFGSSKLIRPTVMKNLLGEEGESGLAELVGLDEAYMDPDIKVHHYGKTETKPFRKMGHITVTKDNLEDAVSSARKAYSLLKYREER